MTEEVKKISSEMEETYMNNVQIKATLVDANVLILEGGRAIGKTTFLASRMKRVVDDMPGELSFLVHKSYVSLMANVVPALRAEFTKPIGEKGESWMEEGIDFIVGTADIPRHFKKPRYPVSFPKHSIIFSDGHNLQLVASDQPDSVAGRSGVHAFIEEMKHNKGDKVKSRLFPALRGATGETRKSPYYQGITGVSDTARVDLGEDNWFEEYEKNMNIDVIEDIFNVAKHVNDTHIELLESQFKLTQEKDVFVREKLRKKIKKANHVLKIWNPILREMKQPSTYYMRASSFANKDFLGEKFFQTQLDTLSIEEFLVAICGLRRRQVQNLFFVGFNKKQHCFSDSYIYNSILNFDLKDTFKLDSQYLKYFDRNKALDLGYDPGNFQSFVVGQENRRTNEYRVLKEFFCWEPKNQGDLAREFFDFFGAHYNKKIPINLYYDRAGNKKKVEEDRITTDARILKRELEAYGFRVKLKNEKQRTIFLYEHYKLLGMILAENLRHVIRLKIDEYECPNLVSAIFLSPLKKEDGKIDLDKSSEVKLDWKYQAGLSTQIPSALMYLIYGKYNHILPKELKKKPQILENTIG